MTIQSEKDMLQRLTACEQSVKSAHHRIDKNDELIQSVQTMAVEMRHMNENIADVRGDISDINGKVAAIEAKPAKRWEALIAAIVGAVAGGVGTAIVGALLGG